MSRKKLGPTFHGTGKYVFVDLGDSAFLEFFDKEESAE